MAAAGRKGKNALVYREQHEASAGRCSAPRRVACMQLCFSSEAGKSGGKIAAPDMNEYTTRYKKVFGFGGSSASRNQEEI